jgi:beta-1,4-mannosyltransferase
MGDGTGGRDTDPVVLAWPAHRSKNPFVSHTTAAIEAAGMRVRELSLSAGLAGGYDVVLVHWPERIVEHRSPFRVVAHLAAWLCIQVRLGLTRTPLVWIAHNERSHDRRHPRLERVFQACFDGRVAAIVYLSEASRGSLRTGRPRLRPDLELVTRHGQQQPGPGAEVPRATAPARALYFGMLRRYKGVSRLLQQWAEVPDQDWLLQVVGEPVDPVLFAELEAGATLDDRGRTARRPGARGRPRPAHR